MLVSIYCQGNAVMTTIIRALIIFLLCLLTAAPGLASDAATAPTVLITGSNRGIGLEFARQYAALGWQVIATCRTPDSADQLQHIASQYPNLSIEKLDITDHAAVDALAERYAELAIDVLLNNAALLGSRGKQVLGNMDYELLRRIIEVNTVGTLKVTEAFSAHVAASRQKKIITLGSRAGSIEMLNSPPDFYAYRASKTALHLLMKNISLALADQGVLVGLINPGLVDTRGFAKIGPDDPVPEDFKEVVRLLRSGVLKLTSPEEAVGQMIAIIENLTAEQSGVFLNADGQVLPW
ncbi:MAG: short-chain dehydrogenase [Chromatiales bacterium]|jgi:NAD(P)-dependent dehydrogenase (short-subunit alcohol dehydrogenase family)|nr:short-chain dehydrogenase [Chromatiales bacterium]